jgi:transposase
VGLKFCGNCSDSAVHLPLLVRSVFYRNEARSVENPSSTPNDKSRGLLSFGVELGGKLLLVTNVPDLKPPEVLNRYKALADIERGFRVLKSEIDIAPVYHRLPQRIRAHAMLCFMALILHRVMRQRLKLAQSEFSPEQALAQLRRIQRHSVSINRAAPVTGVSTINNQQANTLAALNVKKPVADAQMSLL